MNPDIRIFPDGETLSHEAVHLIIQIARQAVAQNGRFTIALCGGGTPQRLFQLLGQSPHKEQMPWEGTHLFWGDERLVSPDDTGSNYGQAYAIFIGKVPIPSENIHRAHGELDSETAVADYKTQLKNFASNGEWPRFDVVLLGLGSDGHTASLFPGSIPPAAATEPVIAVTADYDGRPAQRLSLTPQVFNDAAHVIFLVTGKKKAETVTAVINGPHNPEQLPAQHIQPQNGRLIWFLDQAAASALNTTHH